MKPDELLEEIMEVVETKGCGHYNCEEMLMKCHTALKQSITLEEARVLAVEAVDKLQTHDIQGYQSYIRGLVKIRTVEAINKALTDMNTLNNRVGGDDE